jgi:hypothetical protein
VQNPSTYSAAKAIDLAVITLRRKKKELDFTNTSLGYPNPLPQKITVTSNPQPEDHRYPQSPARRSP